jgi:hypothetical protein
MEATLRSWRWLLATLAFGAVTTTTALIAAPRMMTGFESYDDEGYILIALRSFIDHGSLYERVFSQYGPFYYELWGAVFGLFGITVDHDSGRIVTLVVWVAASLILGLAIYRMLGSIVLGALGQMLSFTALGVAPNEPMHPGGLISLLLILIVAASCLVRDRVSVYPMALLGGLLAALTLTKVNVGVFAVIAVALLCAASYPNLSSRAWSRLGAEAIFVGIPILLMVGKFDEAWARGYAFHVAAAALAAVIALRARDMAPRSPQELVWIVGGFAVTAVIVLLAVVGSGTGLSELYEGVISQPLRQADVFSIPFPWSDRFIYVDAVALATAIGYFALSRGPARGPELLRGALPLFSILVGAEIALSAVGRTLPFDSAASPGYEFGLLAFAWVALIPSVDEKLGSGRSVYAKALLPLLAVLQALHAYPVAGSQVAWSTFLLVPVGLVCVSNGVRGLAVAIDPASRRTVLAVGVAVAAIFVVYLANETLRRPLQDDRNAFHQAAPLELPGARDVRVGTSEEARVYRHVTAAIDRYCNAFLTLPGMNSFYFWTEQEPPTGSNATTWMTLFDDARQQRVVEETSDIPDLCLLENEQLALGWTGGAAPEGPLVDYLYSGFEPIATVGAYTLLRRGGTASG